STSSHMSIAIAMQSKPGPMLAIEAGTLILISAAPSQLQDLSECARVSVQFYRRFYVFQRRVRIFEAGPGQNDHRRRVLLDLALADEPEQQRQRGGRSRLGEQPLAAGQADLGGKGLGVRDGGARAAWFLARRGRGLPRRRVAAPDRSGY